ncbi:hypothetical protein ACWEQL_24410 [Kitasatospora sp. NPDC004240]
MTTEGTTTVVGVRATDEVHAALEDLSTRRRPWTTYEQGMLHAYRWAVGTRAAAPVTADEVTGPPGPCRARLLAECRAAAALLRAGAGAGAGPSAGPSAEAELALGAYVALAWICGLHDERH